MPGKWFDVTVEHPESRTKHIYSITADSEQDAIEGAEDMYAGWRATAVPSELIASLPASEPSINSRIVSAIEAVAATITAQDKILDVHWQRITELDAEGERVYDALRIVRDALDAINKSGATGALARIGELELRHESLERTVHSRTDHLA